MPNEDESPRHFLNEDETKLLMQVLVSLLLLAAGIYILVSGGSSAGLQKAATGWIGLVAGYWLR